MVLTLGIVSLALSREAVGLVVVTRRTILLVHVCWALWWFTTAVLLYVTLSTGAPACGSIGLELTCICTALSPSALSPSRHSACPGITARVITLLQVYENFNKAYSLVKHNYLTCGLPQSQTSSPSLIPLPHTGSPTVVVGSFARHLPRLLLLLESAVWIWLLLQELHCSGAGKLDTAAITHRPEWSLQLHPSR